MVRAACLLMCLDTINGIRVHGSVFLLTSLALQEFCKNRLEDVDDLFIIGRLFFVHRLVNLYQVLLSIFAYL